jgi:hypothetical protein
MFRNCHESIGGVGAAVIYFAAAIKWLNGNKNTKIWSEADLAIVVLLIFLAYLGLVHLWQLIAPKWRRFFRVSPK